MLRVRPIHYTSRAAAFLPIFDALGLIGRHPKQPCYEFDAGSGRVALRQVAPGSPDDGVTHLGFEVRDMRVFAARTRAAGTQAEIIQADHGSSVRISGRDGLRFFAEATEELETSLEADPLLSVNMWWLSPDVSAAAADLRNMGAKPLNTVNNARSAEFSAKNGGKILTQISTKPTHGPLGFGYHGNVEELLARLVSASIEAHIVDEDYGRTLYIANPDFADVPNNPTGRTIWVNEENPTDQCGCGVCLTAAPSSARPDSSAAHPAS